MKTIGAEPLAKPPFQRPGEFARRFTLIIGALGQRGLFVLTGVLLVALLGLRETGYALPVVRSSLSSSLPYWLRMAVLWTGVHPHALPPYRPIDLIRDQFGEQRTFLARDGHCEVIVLESWFVANSNSPYERGLPKVCYARRIEIRITHWHPRQQPERVDEPVDSSRKSSGPVPSGLV